ncbi:MAG TPA: mannosyltransferase [Bacteroidales bacterium]|nr:MAG: hypothetical protein A2X11_07445 [Bacteroidetes bacterium GWE2_42_24]OFY29508.1 MAG: hypothetical protein A2X09_04155 [Bacteroidetes bacterium GWF2_43_11]HAQ64708.1 mannosyltransferase [Bacteroidales bacterium]HBZ67304.1 mannosyltransferase [Bacteroidales bacterium]
MNNSSKIRLHVISFDVPYPANYGGVIDVYHKIRLLHQHGVQVILHCFEYGRGQQPHLEQFCEKVFYYPRRIGATSNFSLLPYIVTSRRHDELLKNLLTDNAPILFEGLHTCGLLGNKLLKNRVKIYRESNIEHQYYQHLAKAEKKLIKKVFFLIEAAKLRFFQRVLTHADLTLVVAEDDQQYLRKYLPDEKVIFLPSFHGNDSVSCPTGIGNYALFQGKLSVPENKQAAEYLIKEVFSESTIPFIVAGMDPDDSLNKLIARHQNITLLANPDQKTMETITAGAQVNIMVTFQPTGLKLKLINTLYTGRHCLVNSKMLAGTGLDSLCTIANTTTLLKSELEKLMKTPFTVEDRKKREIILHRFNNEEKAHELIGYLTNTTTG